jgi:hypothetical protein
VAELIKQGREILFDQANVALFSGRVINEEPITFSQALNHEDPKVRENWLSAINKDFDDMNKQKVWEIIKKEDIPKNLRTIKCKCVFKIKRNCVFGARVITCGYSKFLELTLMKVLLRISMILVFESCEFQN